MRALALIREPKNREPKKGFDVEAGCQLQPNLPLAGAFSLFELARGPLPVAVGEAT